jgi:voltage-gated potassium channel
MLNPLSERIVRFCYWLEDREAYGRLKDRFRDVLENTRSPRKRYFDLFMMLLVLTSVALLVYGVEHRLHGWMQWFEVLAVSVFIGEYLARLWVYNDAHRTVMDHYAKAQFLRLPFRLGPVLAEVLRKKWEYVSSPLAVVDLLAILPSYRPLRILRLFLLFRLFKLLRYSRSMHGMAEVLSEKRFELYTLALFMTFVVLAASSAVYVFEGGLENGGINTFFDAVYWAMVTLSTVGYGDIVTHTAEGRVVALALIVSGIGVLAFTTSIVVSAFQEKLGDLREHRVLSELERMHGYTVICGFGEVGQVVAAKLYQERQSFVVIEPDEAKTRLASKSGYLVLRGNAADNTLLEAVGVRDRVHTLLCATGDDVINVFVTVSARRMNDGLRIISRANKKEVERKLTLAGANHVVGPFEVLGLMGAEYVGRPVAFEAVYGILHGEGEVALETLPVETGSFAHGRSVGEVDFPAHKLLLFGVISSRTHEARTTGQVYYLGDEFSFYFKPGPQFHIDQGDILVVFGHGFSLLHFKRKMDTHGPRRGQA